MKGEKEKKEKQKKNLMPFNFQAQILFFTCSLSLSQ